MLSSHWVFVEFRMIGKWLSGLLSPQLLGKVKRPVHRDLTVGPTLPARALGPLQKSGLLDGRSRPVDMRYRDTL